MLEFSLTFGPLLIRFSLTQPAQDGDPLEREYVPAAQVERAEPYYDDRGAEPLDRTVGFRA